VLAYGETDGANEAADYADPNYTPVNDPLIVKLPGTTMNDPNRWQPLALDFMVTQNGIPLPAKVQTFIGPQWGSVKPFAFDLASNLPPPQPHLGGVGDDLCKQGFVDNIRKSSVLTPDDGVYLDISPAVRGNNPLGTNDGTGYAVNPVTGAPYASNVVKRGDWPASSPSSGRTARIPRPRRDTGTSSPTTCPTTWRGRSASAARARCSTTSNGT